MTKTRFQVGSATARRFPREGRVQRRRLAHTGFTLIELLVVLSLFSFLLVSVAVAIGVLVRAERRWRELESRAGGLSRLAEDLRRDAHQAWQASADGDALQLSLPAAEVTYRSEPQRIVRTLQPRDAAPVDADARQPQFEIYRLPAETEVAWQAEVNPPRLVAVTVQLPPLDETSGARPSQRIEAAIGVAAGAAP